MRGHQTGCSKLVAGDLSGRYVFFAVGWAPQQLAHEIAAGVWYVVAASKDVILPTPGMLVFSSGPFCCHMYVIASQRHLCCLLQTCYCIVGVAMLLCGAQRWCLVIQLTSQWSVCISTACCIALVILSCTVCPCVQAPTRTGTRMGCGGICLDLSASHTISRHPTELVEPGNISV
jgi:Uncharacterized ACR, COG1678